MAEKEKNIRFIVRMPYGVRGLLIRGAARRILNSGRGAVLSEIPSINSLIREIAENRLGVPITLIPVQQTKRVVLMFHMRKRLHEALKADSQVSGKPQTQILKELIENTDLNSLTPPRSPDIPEDEATVSCSFAVPFDCRSRLYHEIALRMLNKKTGIGKSEFASIADICNELVSQHYNIPLPPEKPDEEYVDEEIINFIVAMPESLHAKMKDYCDSMSANDKFTSINKTIIQWCEAAAKREMW